MDARIASAVRATLSSLLLCLLPGCMTYTIAVPTGHRPSADSAYVFGRFTKSGVGYFGLVLEDLERTRKYQIEFDAEEKLVVIEVEPGTYEITEVSLEGQGFGKAGQIPLKGGPSFSVRPNAAYYLGDMRCLYSAYGFTSESSVRMVAREWEVTDYADRYDAAQLELKGNYPHISKLSLNRAFPHGPPRPFRPR